MRRYLNFYVLSLIQAILLVSCNSSNDHERSADANLDSLLSQTADSPLVMPIAVEFLAKDGLMISGVLWQTDEDHPIILLCHQSGSNFHEYDEIAPKLNELGFNCLAIDQRAGGILFDLVNQTADRAISANYPVDFLNAQQDIEAGIDYCFLRYNRPVIVWGSSYSASLALHLGKANDKVHSVIAFSPGDYFDGEIPPLAEIMTDFSKPYFITSARHESKSVSTLLANSTKDTLHVQFIPNGSGIHGSKALWIENQNNEEYWNALIPFLTEIQD